MLHETVREFLLEGQLDSEFAINRKEAHTRIARICLIYLTGDEMKPPRTGRRSATMNMRSKRIPFSTYACSAVFSHLAKADPLANDVWILINRFLESNVLAWIEFLAQTQNLLPLIRAAKNLRSYVHACTVEMSPLGRPMQMLKGWTTDFVRIVARFADALITSPSSIYSVIIPLCPTESSIYQIAKPARKMSVEGSTLPQWDDRLSCIDLREGQTSAVCYGGDFLALGSTVGTVALYHATSYQEHKLLNHREAVRILRYKEKTSLMASCGTKTIKIWDMNSGELVHNLQGQSRILSLAFDKDMLVATTAANFLASWDLNDNGAKQPNRPWNDSNEPTGRPQRGTPCAISISIGHKMLAVAYSGKPIMIWDLEEDQYYGSCGKKLASGETSTHVVTALVFNPNPDIELLAASYLDGELALLDPFNDQQLGRFRANCHTLTSSPDGRLLAGGAEAGTIHIYEFDTLRLLYRVKSSNLYIRQLAFSRDFLHLSDVRGSHCNVWEPPILYSTSVNENSSEGSSATLVDVVASDSTVKISSILPHPKGEYVFCGKNDGSVSAWDLNTGAEERRLYGHKSLIRILAWWDQSNTIMSVDIANGVSAWTLTASPKGGWIATQPLFQCRLDCGEAIVQVITGETAGKFILSTRHSDHLWSLTGLQEDERVYPSGSAARRWTQHQQSPLHIICVEGTVATIYSWADWSEIISVSFAVEAVELHLKNIISISSHSRPLRILLERSG